MTRIVKAKVEVLQKRKVEQNSIVETNVNINGTNRRRRYIVDEDATEAEIQQHISDELNKEANQELVGQKFEVDIKVE